MNEIETFSLALALEVNLDVNTETLKIAATPKKNITPELVAGIRDNRDDILKSLLFSKTLRWLEEKLGPKPGPERERRWDLWSGEGEKLNGIWCDGSVEEFRHALRGCAGEAVA